MFGKQPSEPTPEGIDRGGSEEARQGSQLAQAAPCEDHLARVRRIAATIEAEASERSLRLTPTLQAALHREGLYRLLLPRPFGGFEADPPTFFQAIEAVAKHDASTAWCLCQGNGCAMAAAFLDPEIAKDVWGRDPEAVLAWGPGAKSQAIVEGDGYRLSGRWAFVSGGRHASWLGGHASVIEADGSPRRDADGEIVVRTLLLPAGEATWTSAWDVLGLRATGSDSYEVKDLFVRHDHSFIRDDPAERRYQAPLYLFPQMSLYASGFCGTALGIARAMLDAFTESSRSTSGRGWHGRRCATPAWCSTRSPRPRPGSGRRGPSC
jgi:alkylation response protein AidB-like acyl-CoA dehydrogenase